MNKIHKVLRSLSSKERSSVENILQKIVRGNFTGLDIKKLKDRPDIFRVRKGSLRIIFRQAADGKIFILTLERRSDNTYNK